MGNFIGESAGFAMLILIWFLFLKMIEEFKFMNKKDIIFIRRISLYIIAIGLGYLVLGSFFYNVSIEEMGIFQYDKIWGYGNYAYIMEHVEYGIGVGLFNRIYISVAYVVGKLFFGQYVSALIYVSFIFSIIYGLGIYFLVYKMGNKRIADRVLPFFLLCPFGYKLFLPSPSSMVCSFIVGILWILWRTFGKKKYLQKVSGIASPWLYNIALCMWVGINIMFYYTEMLIR